MEISSSLFRARSLRAAEAVALLGFAAWIVVPSPARSWSLVLMDLACAASVGMALGWAARGPRRGLLAGSAVVSALSLVGSVVYLQSLDPDGASIPLAGMSVLLLALVGLSGTCLTIRDS